MKFEQAIVGNTIHFFKKGFMDRWGFKEYYDPEKPLVIFGYDSQAHIYENHKGYKLIIPSTPDDIPNFQNLTNHKKTIYVSDKIQSSPEEIIFKNETIEIKDYSIFRPNTLGDKIYYYSGFKNGWSGRWGENTIKEIQKNIDYEIITTQHLEKKDMFNVKYLKENYYDNTFLNLNLSKENGMTTVREMGLMGRKTITMRDKIHYQYKCIINCNSVDNIIETINEESKKIGTTQPSINSHTVSDEWLNLEYWIRNNE